ncbi:bacteriohemerythrin [Thiocystis violacea]|uniref:bacteriohemerythrin n=1 Tax=Thiocystis violacea TaxID=13725 RepID=UPI0019060536|nr:bacteriohemerythrin [Thiocystis violacea]MBK1716103.1 hypothetical protein [Thiocystis violacea]
MPNAELILIVDDTLDNLKVLSGLLKSVYRIKVATNGEEALRLTQDLALPDLILLDIMMPGMDGYEVCEQLKSNPRTQDIPVIFLTARTQPDDEARGFRVGAVDYVTKPIHPPLLLARVKAQLALASQLRHTRQALVSASQHIAHVTSERDHSEFQRQRLQDRQQALLAIARSALRDLALEHYLAETLEALGAIPWLDVEGRGALFLVNRKGELIMVAQQGLHEDQRQACAKVPFGICGCGQAAARKQSLFLAQLKEQDGSRYQGSVDFGAYALSLTEGDRVYGVLSILVTPGHQPVTGEAEFMADVAQTFTSLIRRRMAEEILRISQLEIQMARNEVIRRLGVAAEFRDTETGLHILRMSQYAGAIARAMNCDEALCELIELAAPMHDVGKIGIHDSILRKPGKLTAEEFTVMQNHTSIGGRILEGEDPLIRLAREIALTHHEKWDGSGYPNGLRREAIPLSGRVCAVADVFDALTMKRPYKEAWPVEQAMALIEEQRGRAFDPRVVAALRQTLPEILAIKARYQDDSIDPREVSLIPRPGAADAAWIPWRDEYSIGIAIIDEHHRYLFEWTNRVYQAVHERAGTVEIAKALFALEQYTRIHFKAEERLMAECGYLELAQHQQAHRSFETELGELREEIRHNPFLAGMEMLDYLRDWLLEHILKTDKQILEKSPGLG